MLHGLEQQQATPETDDAPAGDLDLAYRQAAELRQQQVCAGQMMSKTPPIPSALPHSNLGVWSSALDM